MKLIISWLGQGPKHMNSGHGANEQQIMNFPFNGKGTNYEFCKQKLWTM